MFKPLTIDGQVACWSDYVSSPSTIIPSGWGPLDALLRSGGFGPATLAVLGGRTQTRKSTLLLNLCVRLLQQGVPVGLIGLDEPNHDYISKVMSVLTGMSVEDIEMDEDSGETALTAYREAARNLVLSQGSRPTVDDLNYWMDEAEVELGTRPVVVCIDHIRSLYIEGEDSAASISALTEDLKVFAREQNCVCLVVTHVGRFVEGSAARNRGHYPVSLEDLKYAGEDTADYVFGVYRPANDPFGNMTRDAAESFKGRYFKYEDWQDAVDRVERYRDSTLLQLLKNRPGTRIEEQGIEFASHNDSMLMEPIFDVETPGTEDKIKAFGEPEGSTRPKGLGVPNQ